MSNAPIDGHCDDGFGAVADAFAANFDERGELGAGFSLYVDGIERVNLWGGVADASRATPWTDDTLQLVFSSTKGAVALCVARLVMRGDLTYDDLVADHWPEFAAAGKDEITVGQLMSHQAGLIALDPPLEFEQLVDVSQAVANLEAQQPLWEPGTAHGYHAITYGWLAGELVARVDGRRIGQFFDEEVARPLGLQFWIGLPAEYEYRVSTIEVSPPPTDPAMIELMTQIFTPGANGYRALSLDGNLRLAPENHFNSRAVHAAELPGACGITNARSLARMYASMIGGVDGDPSLARLDEAAMNEARHARVSGPDQTLIADTRFGAGFWLPGGDAPMIAEGSFGHPGAGGSLGYANPELGIGYGYVMNQMGPGIAGGPRTLALDDAVAASLGV